MTSESSIKFGGGTALVVVVSDEPMMESDLQQHTRMRHVDGRTAVLGGVSKFLGQGFQGHGYLLEFAVPDPGEYRLSLGPGIRDWFGNASSSDRDFTLRFEVTRWMTDGVYEGAPDASLQWASLFDLRFDPELGLKIFEEGAVFPQKGVRTLFSRWTKRVLTPFFVGDPFFAWGGAIFWGAVSQDGGRWLCVSEGHRQMIRFFSTDRIAVPI